MSRETLGYVKLEWVCPKCETRVPGPEKTCPGCGAPQPLNVVFVQALGEAAVADEELEKIAAKGADVHCPFCGTRNSADSVICAQCGADLIEGVRREAGNVVGAYSVSNLQSIKCQVCGVENPINTKTCIGCGSPLYFQPEIQQSAPEKPALPFQYSRYWTLGVIAVLAFLCLLGILAISQLNAPQETLTAQVSSVGWQTAVQILELVSVTHSDWLSEIPQNAEAQNCSDRVYQYSNSEPFGEKYQKICGTPYTIDTGTGVGQVVQDCQFKILRPFCEYESDEWRVVNTAVLKGNDWNPVLAQPNLMSGQRVGDSESEYWIVFSTETGAKTYRTKDFDEFSQFSAGSKWVLELNALGQILSIESAD